MDRSDRDHDACERLIADAEEPICVPTPVIVELDWLARKRLGAGAFDHFLADIEQRAVRIVDLTLDDYARVRELCADYGDLPLGYVDAAVIAVVERFGERKVATLDHRHFGVVRPRHTRSLTLLPPLQ